MQATPAATRLRASPERRPACGAQHAPPAAPRAWTYGATAAAVIFAALAPFTIQAQIGVFLGLLLCAAYPRRALRALGSWRWIGAAFILYFLIQGISIVYSQHPLRSLVCLRGDWPVVSLPVFLVLMRVPRARRWGLAVALAAAALAGVHGLIQHRWGLDPIGGAPLEPDSAGRFLAVGSLGNHLTYGGTMMLALVAAVALWLQDGSRRRALWLAAAAAAGAGLLVSYARTALAGAAVAVLFLLGGAAARARDRRRALLPAGLLLGGALVLLFLSPGVLARCAELLHTDDEPRLRLWGTALRIFDRWPVCGAGLGAFKSHFAAFKLPGSYMATGHPHSDALNVLAHSGLAGALAWLALWASVLGAARGSCRAFGLAVGLSFLVAGAAQCYFTDEEPSRLLWFFLAAAVAGSDPARDPSAAAPAR